MTTNPDRLEVLKSYANEMEAAPIVAALEAAGIQAKTMGGFTAGFRAEAPGDVQVIVRSEDLQRAKELLAEIEKDQTEIDWSQVDVGEPEDT